MKKIIHKEWLEYVSNFAKERRLYHKRRAKQHPEEYPDYKRKEKC